jgi:6-pyruvoyltetrahydropterin/6-carboxytetrahydropterin synthase
LNRDVPFLEGLIPTAENVAVACWRMIEPRLAPFAGVRLVRVRVYESRENFADCLGDAS